MSTSVPDFISSDDLQKMMENAMPEAEPTANPDKQSQEYILDVAGDALNWATEKSAGPVVHKLMLHMIVQKMFEWHTAISAEMMEEGNTCCAMGWSRDAGKFQAIMNILMTISVDENDFTVEDEE